MKKIKLSQGKSCLVDDNKYKELNKYKWTYSKGYAIRNVGGRKNQKCIYMHRLLINTPEGMYTDHIDKNTLNNQVGNLRIVDKSQNMRNSGLSTKNKSGVKGVSRATTKSIHKGKEYKNTYWLAQMCLNKKRFYLGKYQKKEDAIKARKAAEKKYDYNMDI